MSNWLLISNDKTSHSGKEYLMPISLGTASQPLLLNSLKALNQIIDKGVASGAARKIDDTVFTTARLAPDMFTFARQVQIACDFCVRTCARLAGVEVPSHPDTETTFAELKTRINTARTFVASINPSQIDGRDDIDITFPAGPDTKMTLNGTAYLTAFALPNLYFHMAMAYAILRHNGVDVGKGDFMGR
jgi:uncharacterized protein